MLTLIWAQTLNGVIGFNGDMPWYCPEDLAHFKKETKGGIVIMGRKTWQSLPFRPLPLRENIVISRGGLDIEGVETFTTVDAAVLDSASRNLPVFCIGGGQIFEAAMPYADRLLITYLNMECDGDTFAPKVDFSEWDQKSETALGGELRAVVKEFVRV